MTIKNVKCENKNIHQGMNTMREIFFVEIPDKFSKYLKTCLFSY